MEYQKDQPNKTNNAYSNENKKSSRLHHTYSLGYTTCIVAQGYGFAIDMLKSEELL